MVESKLERLREVHKAENVLWGAITEALLTVARHEKYVDKLRDISVALEALGKAYEGGRDEKSE